MHLLGNDRAVGCLHASAGRKRIPSEQVGGCGWQQHAVGAVLGLSLCLQSCAAAMAGGALGLLGWPAWLGSTPCCRAGIINLHISTCPPRCTLAELK